MLKTLQNRRGDQASKEASSPTSNPLSPNYFDVLSEEEDTPPEEIAPQETKLPGTQRAIALSIDPKGKASMPLRDQEAEASEEALQLVLHRSREEKQRRSLGGKGKDI